MAICTHCGGKGVEVQHGFIMDITHTCMFCRGSGIDTNPNSSASPVSAQTAADTVSLAAFSEVLDALKAEREEVNTLREMVREAVGFLQARRAYPWGAPAKEDVFMARAAAVNAGEGEQP